MAKIKWCPGEAEEGKTPPKAQESKDEKPAVNLDRQRVSPSNVPASKDDKLEVNLDGAWFAADLSFRDGTTFVHYEGYSEDEGEEWNVDIIESFQSNIQDKIRVASEQLQDEDCSMVKLKMVVCALRKGVSHEGWYDALVTAVRKTPHHYGVCECVFTVEWLGSHEGRNEERLTCGDLCLLSDKDVATHPTIVDILRRASDARRVKAQEEGGQRRSAPKVRKRESDTEDDNENENENDTDNDSDSDPDYAPNLEEQQVAYLEEQGRAPMSTEPNKSHKSKGLSAASSGSGRMRGSISSSDYSSKFAVQDVFPAPSVTTSKSAKCLDTKA